jgi:hypothetical protein
MPAIFNDFSTTTTVSCSKDIKENNKKMTVNGSIFIEKIGWLVN